MEGELSLSDTTEWYDIPWANIVWSTVWVDSDDRPGTTSTGWRWFGCCLITVKIWYNFCSLSGMIHMYRLDSYNNYNNQICMAPLHQDHGAQQQQAMNRQLETGDFLSCFWTKKQCPVIWYETVYCSKVSGWQLSRLRMCLCVWTYVPTAAYHHSRIKNQTDQKHEAGYSDQGTGTGYSDQGTVKLWWWRHLKMRSATYM